MLILFFLSLAKRVSELQALSCRIAFQGPDLSLLYLPIFVAKPDSERNELHVGELQPLSPLQKGVCAFLASSVSHGVATPPLLPTLTVYYREVPLLVFRLVWC